MLIGAVFGSGPIRLAADRRVLPWVGVNSTFYIGPDPPRPQALDLGPRTPGFRDFYGSNLNRATLVLHASDREFDFGFDRMRPHHHYTGPLFWDPPDVERARSSGTGGGDRHVKRPRGSVMRTSAVLALVAWTLVSPSGGWAETPATVFLEELTWTEVRDLVRSGTTTIILPTGGTEQNGPHMALGKHNVRAKALAAAIARTFGGTLVAPVLAYVPEGGLAPPTGHMRYAGTITLPEPVFEGVLEAAARSFAIHGFRDIVFLGDSGGNQAGQEAVARRLNRGWAATPTRAHAIGAYYRASTAGARALLQSRGYQDREIGSHAGALDTSLMLAVDPSVVRQDRLRPVPAGGWEGADGDPSRASAELGRLIEQTIVAQTAEAIRRSLARREAPPIGSRP